MRPETEIISREEPLLIARKATMPSRAEGQAARS
jgi:hypothetical protein